jgi:hypothetical protein
LRLSSSSGQPYPKNTATSCLCFVDDEKVIPKAVITLKGESAFPKILFDRHEILFPIVPLNVESKVQCYLYNDGYQSVNLKGHIIETFQHFPIKVEFPDGPSLNSKRHKVKVELSFTAKTPISFTTQLFIEDDQKNSYWTYISGTADNSILTNFSYFYRTPKEDYELIDREERPLALKFPEKNESALGSERNISVTQSKTSGGTANKIGLGYTPIPFDILERCCKHMAKFLTVFVPGITIDNFPNDIINRNGDILTKIVEFYAQTSLGVKSKFTSDMKKADKVTQTIENYKIVLNFLRKEGAFLNNIRPEYLLSWNDLLMFYKKKQSPNVATIASKLGENAHKYLSADSWLILLNQVLKIYFVNKITVPKFKALTTFPDNVKKLPTGAEQSSIFSVSEQILLKWMELCFEKTRDSSRRIFPMHGHVGKLFRTGLPYASLIQVYTSNSWKPMKKMRDVIINDTEAYENMNVVMETFSDMSLHYIPEFGELASVDPRESILFVSYLFNVLPSYQPKDTIVFETKIGDTVSKKVTLQNPHLQLLIYNVMLDANSDYSISEQQVKIEPKTQHDFIISFTGRISKPLVGKLIFKPRKEGDLLMAPIVYELKSKITGRYTTEKKIIKDVALYEQKMMELKLTNNFTKDCSFSVYLEYLPSSAGDAHPKRRRLAGPKGNAAGPSSDDKILPCFFIRQSTVPVIKKGRSRLFKFIYLPLSFEIHHCNLVFIDEDVGELQYELIGIPMYPPPISSMGISTSLDQIKPHDLFLSFKNKHMEKAHDSLKPDIDLIREPKVKAALISLIQSQKKDETFRIDSTAPKDLSYPTHLTLHDTNKIEKQDLNAETPSNTMTFNISIRYPVKDYAVNLILKNNDLTDVRVFEYNITILPKIFKAIVEFSTPVKIPLEQGIPVTNPTEHEVVFGIKKEEGVNGDYFQVPSALKVRGLQTDSLPVTFCPAWKGNSSALIKITNPATSEEFHYTLKGIGEEPLSENHFKLACNVGDQQATTNHFGKQRWICEGLHSNN